MKRGKFGGVYWYHEFKHWSFTIDLADWGVRAKFGASWEVQLLCFKVFQL
jgi:hypothetical protein